VLADETPGGQTGTEEAVVPEEQVAQEEIESRDEGFGGGQEAKEFVEQVKVEDGHVEKKL
jgi:large subunit ribosomal protein L47